MHLFLLLSTEIFNKVMAELLIENKDLTHDNSVSLSNLFSVSPSSALKKFGCVWDLNP